MKIFLIPTQDISGQFDHSCSTQLLAQMLTCLLPKATNGKKTICLQYNQLLHLTRVHTCHFLFFGICAPPEHESYLCSSKNKNRTKKKFFASKQYFVFLFFLWFYDWSHKFVGLANANSLCNAILGCASQNIHSI